jgi:hypothetical protein
MVEVTHIEIVPEMAGDKLIYTQPKAVAMRQLPPSMLVFRNKSVYFLLLKVAG